jgi:hypothetical protein
MRYGGRFDATVDHVSQRARTQMKKALLVAAVLLALGTTAHADSKREFQARLTGDQEVPPVVTDATGRFEIKVDRDFTSGEYTLRVNDGVRLTQAHFHCGSAGNNGPVIVFLAGFHAPGWDVDGKWVSNATITNANIVNTTCGATLAEIFEQARAGNVYVNVHSVANPAGVVRGQLLPAGRDRD